MQLVRNCQFASAPEGRRVLHAGAEYGDVRAILRGGTIPAGHLRRWPLGFFDFPATVSTKSKVPRTLEHPGHFEDGSPAVGAGPLTSGGRRRAYIGPPAMWLASMPANWQ